MTPGSGIRQGHPLSCPLFSIDNVPRHVVIAVRKGWALPCATVRHLHSQLCATVRHFHSQPCATVRYPCI